MVGHCSVKMTHTTGKERREEKKEKEEEREEGKGREESSQGIVRPTFESFAGSLGREFIYYDVL